MRALESCSVAGKPKGIPGVMFKSMNSKKKTLQTEIGYSRCILSQVLNGSECVAPIHIGGGGGGGIGPEYLTF